MIWLLLALGVGLWLRLWQIDLTHFDLDQSTLLANAEVFVRTGQIPLSSGLTFSTGGRGPALPTVIAAIPFVFVRDPAINSAFQAAIDATAIVFLYQSGRDLGGRWSGVAAGLMYAVLPAAVMHARVVWNPNLVPFFSAVALWGAIGCAKFGDSRRLAAALFALGCAGQLHPLALVLFPVVLIVAVQQRQSLRWSPIGWAVLALFAVAAPFLILQVSSGWEDVRAVLTSSPIGAGLRPLAAVEAALLLVGGSGVDQVSRRAITWPFPIDPAFWLMLGLTMAGAIAAMRMSGGWTVLLWGLLPVLAGVRAADPLPPHYIHALLPAAALLAGLGLATLRPPILGRGLLALLVGWRLVGQVALMHETADGAFVSTYGAPLRYLREASDRVSSLHGNRTVLAGEMTIHAGLFHFLSGGDFDPRTFDAHDSLLVNGGGLYLVEPGGFAAEALLHMARAPVAVVSAANGKALFQIFEVTPAAAAAAVSGLEAIEGDIGHLLQLRGFSLPRLVAGHPAASVLAWEVTDSTAESWRDVRMFAEIVGGDGTRWSTRPDMAVPRIRWSRGDVVLRQTAFDIFSTAPSGGYWLETGFYRSPSFDPLPLYENQVPRGGRLRLGPVKVAGLVTDPGPLPAMARFGEEALALVELQRAGSSIRLGWRALRGSLPSYTVFVHGLDAEGRVVAQHDSPPAGGGYPTSLWEAGDFVEDVHQLDGSWAQAVALEIGLYDALLARMTVWSPDGVSLGDRYRIELGNL